MFTAIVSLLAESRSRALLVLGALVAANGLLFGSLGALPHDTRNFSVSFLDVGQGDASLIKMENDVQILIDGGPPNGKLVTALGEIMSPYDRRIELVVLTHPELDHYGGLIELLDRYEVGTFIDTGVTKDVEAYHVLMKELEVRKIRRLTLRAGDHIRYGTHAFSVLSPDDTLVYAKEKNDTSMVLALESNGAQFLFTGDIGAEVERVVAHALSKPVDVLKVSHHGSKFSSVADFLSIARPALATIGVGKNSYGHPTRETLARLEAAGARVYRTDRDGTITVQVESDALRVFVER